MKTRCINLKDWEVRGLLDNSITALWRPVSERHLEKYNDYADFCNSVGFDGPKSQTSEADFYAERSPWQPGDVLIGREAWGTWFDGVRGGVDYKADHPNKWVVPLDGKVWRSAAVMPSRLSRIRREMVAVECIQGKDRPIEDPISVWEAERETWFWKLKLGEAKP